MSSKPKVGTRYYSLVVGTRHWWYTGKYISTTTTLRPEPGYVFEDVCDHTRLVTQEEFDKYFEEK